MPRRWDETFHRLSEWTNGQGPAERLAAQLLLHQGYTHVDPSHPLGGRDGLKDAVCSKRGKRWIMAVYFPRGKQRFSTIRQKFRADLTGVASNDAKGIAFVTNQELTVAQRKRLRDDGRSKGATVDLFHLEHVVTILDSPPMQGVREQFLAIDALPSSTAPPAVRLLRTISPGTEISIRSGQPVEPDANLRSRFVAASDVDNALVVEMLWNMEEAGAILLGQEPSWWRVAVPIRCIVDAHRETDGHIEVLVGGGFYVDRAAEQIRFEESADLDGIFSHPQLT